MIIKLPKIDTKIFAVFKCGRCGCEYIVAKNILWGSASHYGPNDKRVYDAECPACLKYNQYVDEEKTVK
jgi:hypothetical protein